MSFIAFFAIVIAMLALAYLYVGRRLIRPARLPAPRRRMAWIVIGVFFVIPMVPFLLSMNRIEGTAVDTLAFAGYTLLGFFSLVLTGVVVRDLIAGAARGIAAARRILRRFHERESEVNRERRRVLIHGTNIGVLGLAAATGGYGFFEARRRAVVEEIAVPLRNLPPEFDGFRIVQFTDLHVGPTIKREFVERVAEQVQALNADVIAFTGDLVDGSVRWLANDVAPLADLRAPSGVYFITGNHEYYSGAEQWIREAERLGFDVLMNEHRVLEKSGARVVLAGVTDYGAGDFIPSQTSSPARAAEGAPGGTVKILLAHQPRSVFAAERAGFDLQLSGHTHGGQFIPWNYLAMLAQPYIKGLHQHGRTAVYVSRGTGYWGPPVRLGNAPEITVITLRQA